MSERLGFLDARKRVIHCLRQQAYDHEPRKDINQKNLLHTGRVSPEEVVEMLLACSGKDHATSPHDMDRTVEVHTFKPKRKFDGWYIKCYFVPDGTMFISVHH